ncbi:MAG: hypothetical protein JXR44_08145 [Thiotrichales bacterium]|nr:hypothetical protein [Thiotrichales bacterium]
MQYLLYVTELGFKAYQRLSPAGELPQAYAWDDIALIERFVAGLSTKDSVLLLLDLIDEDLMFEWVPKVMPWERKALLQRRKQRLNTEKVALSEVHSTGQIQKSESGRAEELILSATISDAFKLTRFLNHLESAQVSIDGIYSKPFLLQAYFDKVVRPTLSLTKEQEALPFLIISRHCARGYRQTLFHDGQMRLSRIVQIEEEFTTPEAIHKALLDETNLAITYVYNQKIIPFKHPIGLIFLEEDSRFLETLAQDCKANGILRSSWEDRYFLVSRTFAELSKGLRYCSEQTHCYSEQAIIDFLFNHPQPSFYRTSYIERLQTFRVWRQALYGVNTLVFLGALTFILLNAVDNYLSWQRLGLLDQNIVAHEREKQRLTELVRLQDDAQQIKASVEFSEAVLSLRVDRLVGFDLQTLSDTLKRHPNIQLNRIDWKSLQELDSKRHEILLEGWVFPFYETYRNPVQWVDALVADLRAMPQVETVTLDKEPLNRDLQQATRIETDLAQTQALPFNITVRMKDGELK